DFRHGGKQAVRASYRSQKSDLKIHSPARHTRTPYRHRNVTVARITDSPQTGVLPALELHQTSPTVTTGTASRWPAGFPPAGRPHITQDSTLRTTKDKRP